MLNVSSLCAPLALKLRTFADSALRDCGDLVGLGALRKLKVSGRCLAFAPVVTGR